MDDGGATRVPSIVLPRFASAAEARARSRWVEMQNRPDRKGSNRPALPFKTIAELWEEERAIGRTTMSKMKVVPVQVNPTAWDDVEVRWFHSWPCGPYPISRDGRTIRIPVSSYRHQSCLTAMISPADYRVAMSVAPFMESDGYPKVKRGGRTIALHRLILPAPAGLVTDHVCGRKLDARRGSLRLATVAQNAASARCGPKGRGTSHYRGVSRRGNRWQATAGPIRIGTFATQEEAARRYDEIAIVLWGREFARLNFPTGATLELTRSA